jgi:AraC family transcriptional regulator
MELYLQTETLKKMFKELLNHINNNLDSTISLDSLSKVAGYSPYYLHRKFKEESGETIGSFLQRQRIETAAYLLAITRLPISEIKYLVGYSTDSSFSKAFRKVLHTSPSLYRSNNQFKKTLRAISVNEYLSLNYQKVILPEQSAIVFPSVGDYFSKEIYSVWKDVGTYLKLNGFDEKDFEYYGVLHVCQNITPGTASRYDAVIIPKPGLELSTSKYFKSQIPGGRYIRYRLSCKTGELQKLSLIIGKHLEDEGFKHGTGASYFKFDKLPDYKNPDNLLISWFIPLES